jgi:hypothetical protein
VKNKKGSDNGKWKSRGFGDKQTVKFAEERKKGEKSLVDFRKSSTFMMMIMRA